MILQLNNEAMDWNLTYTKKDNYNYENSAGKKIVGHSKLKLWIFLWGQVKWPLIVVYFCMA